MKKNYRTTKTTVSKMQFHVVFCTRYKRKIFNVDGVKERFEMLARAECERQEIEILEMHLGPDYVHMKIDMLPKLSVNDALFAIKKHTGQVILDEYSVFSSMQTLWTKSYFVTTDAALNEETIRTYVDSQANGPIDARKKREEKIIKKEWSR